MAQKAKSKKVLTEHGRASILKRSDGLFVGRFTTIDPNNGQSKRVAVYGRDYQECSAKVVQALAAGPVALQGRGQTLEQYTAHWLKVKAAQTRDKSLERYRGLLEDHTLPTLGKVKLADLTKRHVEALMAAKKAEGKLSNVSINKIRQTLRTLLNDAMDDELVTSNAAAKADPLPEDGKPVGFLDATQARKLLDVALADDDGSLWTVALTTGMRQSEILGLRWSDVDLDQATLSISRTLQRSPTGKGWLIQSPKTKRSRRTLPLASVAVEALQRQRKAQAAMQLAAHVREWAPAVDSTGHPIANEGPDGLIFTNGYGHPLMGNVVTKRLRKALKDAGLPTNVHFHGLRHSTASLLQARGVPARVAMDILGHSNIATTQNIYQHVSQVQHREAVAAISEALA